MYPGSVRGRAIIAVDGGFLTPSRKSPDLFFCAPGLKLIIAPMQAKNLLQLRAF
ncbi:MAG: hypothetical protein ACJAUG_001401 [Halioglobus sp.]